MQSDSETNRRRHPAAEDPTVVLPIIHDKFKAYFTCLKPISNPSLDPIHRNPRPNTPRSSIRFENHLDQHDQVQWAASRPWKVSQNGEDFYQSVRIQNHLIKIDSVVCCQRITGREFSYRKSRLTTVDTNYGSDTEDEREEDTYEFHDDEVDTQPTNNNFVKNEKPPKPNTRRFLVRALFERDRVKYFHGTWLEEARHSFVGASAEPLELLLVDQCYEIELKHVSGIEKVMWMASHNTEPPPNDTLYCRFHWKPTKASLVDLPRVRKPNPPNPISNSHSLCPTCVAVPKEIAWLTDPHNGKILLGKTDQYEQLGFTLRGEETYRLNDFVRVANTSPSKPQVIGQIVEICGIRANSNADKTIVLDDAPFRPPAEAYSKIASLKHKPVITIRKYQRTPWSGTEKGPRKFFDDRRLWITGDEQLVDVRNQLQGKCEIVHLTKEDSREYRTPGSGRKVSEDSIIERDNCFYSILPSRKQQRYKCSVPVMNDSWKASLASQEPEWVKTEDESRGEQYKDLVKDYGCGKIRHLELFGGIGSMSVTLIELGLASQDDTMFIDFSIPACQTISTNFPRSKVICADVNDVFELMITGKTVTGDDFLVDKRTGKSVRVDELPRPGDFDLITAGFPCGSHSTLNVLRKANDSKNALCATALSFIAYLKPDYLFFENVRGLLKTSFVNPADDSVLNKAFLRIICGTLISLGYQVRFGVLQAAQFGSPQARRRIIFAGTKHGLTSIKLPEPTHHFPDESLAILLPTNDKDKDASGQNSVRADHRTCSSGALRAVTIHDAIADLPEFEYINPNKIMGRTRSTGLINYDHYEGDDGVRGPMPRRPELIPQLDRLISFSPTLSESRISMIGFDEFEYVSEPMNRYQSWLRKPLEWKPLIDTFIPKYPRLALSDGHQAPVDDPDDDDPSGSGCRVRNWHVTPRFSSKVTERICNIPLKPNADHRDLPKPLRLKNLKRARNPRDFDGNYGRLGFQDQFNTIITKMHPHNQNKCGAVLHPNQNRTLSLLEAQRAQGFPDRFKLQPAGSNGKTTETINQQLFKLIGNSIPIPISFSLSRSLLKAREEDYLKTTKLQKLKCESVPPSATPPGPMITLLGSTTIHRQDKGKQRLLGTDDEDIVEVSHPSRTRDPRSSSSSVSLDQQCSPAADSIGVNSNSAETFEYEKNLVDCLDLLDLFLDHQSEASRLSTSSCA